MNNITYETVEEKYTLSGKSYISYGIVALADDEEGTPAIVASVRNISSDEKKLRKLVTLCNELKLSPIHLNNVVEDFVS